MYGTHQAEHYGQRLADNWTLSVQYQSENNVMSKNSYQKRLSNQKQC